MDQHEERRTKTREDGLSLLKALLLDDARNRRYSRHELVVRDGVLDHITYARTIKIDQPNLPKAA